MSRRVRVILADREGVPEVYLDVLQTALQSLGSASARTGRRVFDTLRLADEVMGMAQGLRNELNASDSSASFPQDVANLFQPSSSRVVMVIFGRSAFALKCQRGYIRSGAKLRNALVSALEPKDMSAQERMSTPLVGEWPPPIARDGRSRSCAAPGRTKCTRRLVMIVRGMTQLARPLLDRNTSDSAWLLRARHGADNSRAPRGVRESVETTARRCARRNPTCEAPQAFWRDTEALKHPAAVCNAAKPQAAPSDVLPGRVVVLDADLVPRAS